MAQPRALEPSLFPWVSWVCPVPYRVIRHITSHRFTLKVNVEEPSGRTMYNITKHLMVSS